MLQKLESYGHIWVLKFLRISLKECKKGENNVYWALKVNICSLLHLKLNLAPKTLVETSFLIIYIPFLLVSITIDIPGTRVWSKVEKWYWRFFPVSLLKIDLQKTNLHQMNQWKVFFLAYFIINIPKVNIVGPSADQNIWRTLYNGGFTVRAPA